MMAATLGNLAGSTSAAGTCNGEVETSSFDGQFRVYKAAKACGEEQGAQAQARGALTESPRTITAPRAPSASSCPWLRAQAKRVAATSVAAVTLSTADHACVDGNESKASGKRELRRDRGGCACAAGMGWSPRASASV